MFKDRRKLPIMALIGAALVTLFVIACGDDDTAVPRATSTPPPQATAAPVATPTAAPAFLPTPVPPTPKPATGPAKPEGKLTLAVASFKGASGIPFSNGMPGQIFTHFAQEQMVNRELDMSLSGRIAEDWSLQPDAGTVTFNIRKGIQFHDGYGELTAEDVKWSMQSVGQVGASSWRWDAFSIISEFEIPDPYTLIAHLPVSDFFLLLDSVYQSKSLGINVTSKAFHESVSEEEAFGHYVGSGPWDHLETSQGDYMRFQAFENHYNKTPEFATLEVREVPEAGSRLAMVRVGEADVIKVQGNFVGEAQAAGVKVLSGVGGSCSWIQLGGQVLPERPTFNPNTNSDGIPWVGDPNVAGSMENALKVRQALNLAVDRATMVETLFQDLAYPCANPGYYRDHAWQSNEWEDYGYDPVKAKALLVEAGYPNGFDMTLNIDSNDPSESAIGEVYSRWWEENLGLKVARRPVEDIVVRPRTIEEREMGSETPEGWTSGSGARTEPWQAISVFVSTTDSLRGAERAFIDDLFPQISKSFDVSERMAKSLELMNYIRDNYLVVGTVVEPPVFAVSDRVGNYSNRFGGDWNYTEFITRAD